MNMEFYRKLPIPKDIKEQFPLTAKMAEQKEKNDITINIRYINCANKWICSM